MKSCYRVAIAGIFSFWLSERATQASTFEFGNIEAGDSKYGIVEYGANQSFEDTFRFSLADLAASLYLVIRDLAPPYDIDDFELSFFSEDDPTTPLDTVTGPLGSNTGVYYFDLAAGNYFFLASGTSGPDGLKYRYDFHRNYGPGGPPEVGVVPLPPALLLFATSLAALGFLGAGRRARLKHRSA